MMKNIVFFLFFRYKKTVFLVNFHNVFWYVGEFSILRIENTENLSKVCFYIKTLISVQ